MIVLDVETTGTDPVKHSMVSMGAVEYERPNNQFYTESRIWNGAEINPKSLEINGFSEQQIRNCKTSLEKAVSDFIAWSRTCKDRMIAGMHPSFDRDFTRRSAERYGINWDLSKRTIDLHTVAFIEMNRRDLHPKELDTTKIYEFIGLPEEPKPHNALTGAKMEAEAFSRLLAGTGLLDEFKKYGIPQILRVRF